MTWQAELAKLQRPRPEDFGISDADVKRIPDWVNDSDKSILFSLGAFFVFLLVYTDWTWLGTIAFMFFPGLFGALALSGIIHGLSKTWKMNFVKGYSESKKLEEAVAEYDDRVRDLFDRHLLAMGVGNGDKYRSEEDHERNLQYISSFGSTLEELGKMDLVAASTNVLKYPKSTIKSAILDEIFAAYLCEKTALLGPLGGGLCQLAIFQNIDQRYVIDPISKVTRAAEEAKSHGIEVKEDALVRAIADVGDSESFAAATALQSQILDEQRKDIELLSELRQFAKAVREYDPFRMWGYERYFQKSN